MSAVINPNEAHACIVEAVRDVIRRSPDIEDLGLCVRASEDTLRRMRDAHAEQPEAAWTIARLVRFISYEQRTLRTNRLALRLLDVMSGQDEANVPVEMRALVRIARQVASQLSSLVAALLSTTADDNIDTRERFDIKARVADLREGLQGLGEALDAHDRDLRAPLRVRG